MKIRIEIEDTSVTATLDSTEAARDFASLLPLTMTLEDYNSTEKIAYLPRKLSTDGAPPGSDPDVGDIAYYSVRVSDEYLAFLRARGVSYLLASRRDDVDLPLALEKIRARFGVHTLMLGGGRADQWGDAAGGTDRRSESARRAGCCGRAHQDAVAFRREWRRVALPARAREF